MLGVNSMASLDFCVARVFFFFFLFRSLRLDKTDLFFSPAAVPFLVVDALSFLPVDIGGEGWHDPTVKKNV